MVHITFEKAVNLRRDWGTHWTLTHSQVRPCHYSMSVHIVDIPNQLTGRVSLSSVHLPSCHDVLSVKPCACTHYTLQHFACDGPKSLPKTSICPITLLVAQQKETPLPLWGGEPHASNLCWCCLASWREIASKWAAAEGSQLRLASIPANGNQENSTSWTPTWIHLGSRVYAYRWGTNTTKHAQPGCS